MTRRNLLHRTKLEAFLDWCRAQGFTVETKKAVNEVARVRVPGVPQPALIYARIEGDHYTVFGTGEGLVRRFLKGSSRPSPEAT